MIHRHGDLERCARDEAERFGFSVRVRDLDLDPHDDGRRGYRAKRPGAGVIDVSGHGSTVSLEYWLPEDEDEFRRTIRAVARGDESERNRLTDPHAADGGV